MLMRAWILSLIWRTTRNQLDVGNKKDQNNYNPDVLIIQSQKTTEYSREPKQKQANGAQVIEITVYKDE